MGTAENRDVVIVVFHYSVVVKGIERKIAEMGYRVFMVTESFEKELHRYGGEERLLVLYLPNDLMENPVKKDTLLKLSAIITEQRQRTLILGEKKYHDDLLQMIPALGSFLYLSRPVEMNVLEEAVEKAANSPVVIKGQKKRRILIVDDDPSYAKMVREWIKTDYRVDIVTAGMQAITFLLKVKPDEQVDMILLDYEMPVVDGPQVLQMLRQEPATDKIPIIFLTGVGTKEAVSRVMSLKPDGYILKSTTRDNLLAFLKEKLG